LIDNVSTFSGGNMATIKWLDSTVGGKIKIIAHDCNPSSGNQTLPTTNIPVLSINGVNPGTITGASSITVNVTTNQQYDVPQINFPNRGSGDVNPYQVPGYQWEFPSGWTVISGGNTKSVIVKPDNCTGGNIRVRGINTNCNGATYYTNWSTVKAVTRALAAPGTITGPASLSCSDTSVKTYSISPVTGATSYIWTLPAGWSGSSTTASINVNPSGTVGGIVSVKAVGCDIQTAAATKNVTINIPDLHILGSDVVCNTTTPYTISNLPQGSTVSWSVTPQNIVQINSPNSQQTTLTASGTGEIYLTANVTYPCGQRTVAADLRVGVYTTAELNSLISVESPVCRNRTVYCSIDNTNLQDVTNYTWSWGSGLTYYSGQGTPQLVLQTSASFNGSIVRVKVTNPCGTSSYSSPSFIEYDASGCSLFSISPNPSSSILKIEPANDNAMKSVQAIPSEIQEVEMIDKMGTKIYSNKIGQGTISVSIDVSGFPNDVYTLRIFDGEQWYTNKVIVQH
jgi:large repetitive protein